MQNRNVSKSAAASSLSDLPAKMQDMSLKSQTNTLISKRGKVLHVIPRNSRPQECFCGQSKGRCSSLHPKNKCHSNEQTEKKTKIVKSQQVEAQSLSLAQIMKEEKAKKRQVKQLKPARTISDAQEVEENASLITRLVNALLYCPIPMQQKLYTLENVNLWSTDYFTITKAFANTMTRYKITSIKQVVNPFLLLHYNLKKQHYDFDAELLLYHGTKVENVDSICTDNFDWRLVSRHKYGWGVSFSRSPYYASHYADQSGSQLVMLGVKVLIDMVWKGDCATEVPEQPFDTTTDTKGKVYVKYDDCSFYPEYVIYYMKK